MLFSRIKHVATAALIALGLSAGSADASVLYSNGPIDGVHTGFTISVYQVADSFTLASKSTLHSVEFGSWVAAGQTFDTVDWSILTGIPGSGTVLYSGTANALNSYLYTNFQGLDVYLSGFFLPSITLNAGTYWLELTNATGSTASIFWDINGGPSSAWDSYYGDVTSTCNTGIFPTGRCSSSFQISGSITPAPEPGTMALLIGGMLLLGTGLYRRIRA